MKKLFTVIASALILVGISSCQKTKEKINELTEFDLTYSTTQAVPANTLAINVPVDFTTPNVPTESATKFANQNTAQSLISEIKFTNFNISVNSGNLDFLKTVSIYIKAAGVGEQLIGTKAVVPAGVMSFNLDLSDVNVMNYIFQPNIQFRIRLETDGVTAGQQDLKLSQTLRVKATLLN
jgi:hypothetical protein